MATELSGYRFVKQIGTGAGSKIYRAVELVTRNPVAIKHVERTNSDDDRFIAQAENEHEICCKLDHSSLRQSYSIHRKRGLLQVKELYVVMEYVEGLTLEKARPNRLNTFLTVFQRIAQGLHAMHDAGFVHADIKPTNIMLAKGAAIKIIDFGQACPINHRKERIQGTPDYIAPEQVRRMPLDRRTDIFNLGATMYWVLTSETYPTAIQGADPRGGMRLTSADKPLAPIELNDKIPLALSKFVMECCSKNPADRPAEMMQVHARLDAVRKVWQKQLEAHRTRQQDEAVSKGGVSSTSQPPAADPSTGGNDT